MKLEGGSNVKSPWYYRIGARPVGVSRMLSYSATLVGPHVATVRAQVSPTSTLMVYIGNVSHFYVTTTAGTLAREFGTYVTYDSTSTYGFSTNLQLSASVNVGQALVNNHHIGDFMSFTSDTCYLMTIDATTGAHLATYATNVSVEWFGR
jgi:hypothetical protein